MLTTEEKIDMLEGDLARYERYIVELKKQILSAKSQQQQKPFPIEVTVQNHTGQLLNE